MGFIAQEVKVIPQIVYGEEGNLSIGYAQLTYILTESITRATFTIRKR